jgi:type III pantothenate kinase
MTQWVFDLGNSRVKCAPLQADGTLGPMLAFAYDDALLAALDAEVPATVAREASTAVLASVASPERTATVVDWLTTRFGTVSIARTRPRWRACASPTLNPSGWAWTASWRCCRRAVAVSGHGWS